MTPDQIDNDLDEISTRLERVRALYEQYFMGIERLEPTIPRKDLERRIQVLRKTRFQNTAKRFKFQTLVQRYNSLQQYWNRTCRDIENGTYKKHLQRAERRFGLPTSAATPDSPDESREKAEKAAEAKEQATADLASLLDADTDLDAAMGNVLAELEQAPAKKASADPNAPSAGNERSKTGTGLLGKLAATPASPERQTGLRTKTSPNPVGLKGLPPLKRSTTSPRAATPAAPPNTSTEQTAASPKPAPPARPASPAPPTPPPRPRTSPSPTGLSQAPRPGGATTPSATKAGKPPIPPPRARPATAPVRPAATEAARPVARPAPPPRAAGAARSGSSGLSEERIKALHQSYVSARKKTNASEVSIEKLAKSLRDTEQKLRAKHKGRNIDFDVSIKDGKAILKPKLK